MAQISTNMNSINTSDLQIYNNAAFDPDDSTTPSKPDPTQDVDTEIKQVEKQMENLASRLETLKAKKHKLEATQSPLKTKSKRRKWSLPAAEGSGRRPPLCDMDEEKENRKEFSPACLLPRIRTSRCGVGSPRDSGPAKRVVELVGRKTHFGGLMESSSAIQSLRCEDNVQIEDDDLTS